MNGAFYIGAIGLDAQQRALEVVANNIANINTPSFKRQAVDFSELVGSGAGIGDGAPAITVPGGGVTVDASPRIFTQGTINSTGQSLDLAIQGTGYLEVLGMGGHDLLWRGGTLTVNQDGYLATSDGQTLRAMVSVPLGAQNLTIDPTGVVSANIYGTQKQIGALDLVMVKDEANLTDAGTGLYAVDDPTNVYSLKPGTDGSGTFVQGALEGSNVELADEMVNLLLMQRAYGASAQVVQAGDQLMSIANNLRR